MKAERRKEGNVQISIQNIKIIKQNIFLNPKDISVKHFAFKVKFKTLT